MSFTMLDAGLDHQDREVAVDPLNPKAGSFRVTFQPIPVGKYRSLCKDLEDKRAYLAKVNDLIKDPISFEGVTDFDEVERLSTDRDRKVKAREKAEEALYLSLLSFVGWGIIGFSEIVKPDLTPYPPAQPKAVKWGGYNYLNLDDETLHLFGRLGLLWQLAYCILAFNNGQLPETLEGFYKQDPK